MVSLVSAMVALSAGPLNGIMTAHEPFTLGTFASVPAPVERGTGTGTGVVLILAMVATGLTAGVYFAYATSVMLGLAKTADRTFIEVMQKINVAIQNPVFFLAFFGAFVLTAVGAWQLRHAGWSGPLGWAVVALALYTLGLLITMAANVPLNDRLAAAGDPARIADPAAVRAQFENAWNAWNIARALASAAALACLGQALRGR